MLNRDSNCFWIYVVNKLFNKWWVTVNMFTDKPGQLMKIRNVD